MAMTIENRENHLVRCTGEAHRNPYIDHCVICAPRWGWVEVPKSYSTLSEYRDRVESREKAESR